MERQNFVGNQKPALVVLRSQALEMVNKSSFQKNKLTIFRNNAESLSVYRLWQIGFTPNQTAYLL
ncbi:MAG TPA: hypothetical protein DDW73_22610 [Rhizobium sp.]|jgi:hypothetical protein|nr:hypothetical protein [Rhizobium sp.]